MICSLSTLNTIFESDDTDAVLLIDASNAFNALNRAAALHNIRILCPIIAIYAINTYRQPARLFVIGGKEIVSAEGTTQGDPLAMGLYALSIQPLITSLQAASSLQMMPVELAPLWKLGHSGMPIAPLVQILVIFRTTGNAGSSQNQQRKKVLGKLSRTRP